MGSFARGRLYDDYLGTYLVLINLLLPCYLPAFYLLASIGVCTL